MATPTARPGDIERALRDPGRLREMADLQLEPSRAGSFSHVAELVARVLGVPLALVTVVDDHRQRIVGKSGVLPEPFETRGESDLDHSFCKHVVATGQPLAIVDARVDPALRTSPAIGHLGIVGYLGVPLRSPEGRVLGSVCAISPLPRSWTEAEILMMNGFAEIAASELALRAAVLSAESDRMRLAAILDNAAEGILGLATTGLITFANRMAERLLGRTAAELIGEDAHHVLHGAGGEAAVCGPDCLDEALVRSGKTFMRDTLVRRQDGSTFPARYTSALKRNHGSAPGVVLLFRDRSDEVALEHQREEFAGRFRAVFEHSPDAMLLTIPDGSILEANEAACEMFGRTIEQLRTLGRGAVVDVTDPRLPPLLAMRKERGFASGGLRMRRADGSTFEAEVSSTVFDDQEGRALTSMSIRDVSERMRLEGELRQAATRLAERVDAELQFEALLGHELRTPLLAMTSFARLLRREGMSLERARELAAYLERDAERAERLIDELLELDRVESGRAPLLIEPVELRDLLTQIVATVASSSPRHRIGLAVEGPSLVLGDRDRLVQVFTNLLGNAMKYSPDGGKIEIAVRQADGRILTSIRDEGLGIAAADLERIFQKHTRIERRDIKGSGLGLQLARAIVEQHGGKIWAESAGEGAGATFSVLLTAAVQNVDPRP